MKILALLLLVFLWWAPLQAAPTHHGKPTPTPALTYNTWETQMDAYIASTGPTSDQLVAWITAHPPFAD